MIASLPMYDRRENRAAHDAFWVLVRDRLRGHGITAPDALDRATPFMEGWGRPDLVLGQICNLPYRAHFRGRVTVIGAADYGLPGAGPGLYNSVLVVRADDPARDFADCAGYRFAFNEGLSNSGWGKPQQWALAQGRPLRPTLQTGAHVESLRAVVGGRADLAALDAVTFRNLQMWDPLAHKVRVIARTHTSPGMSFITAPGLNPAPYFNAISAAIAFLPAPHRATLGLRGIVALSPDAYDLPLPPLPQAVLV